MQRKVADCDELYFYFFHVRSGSRGITFDMRGGGRLAGRRPLDGRVRPAQQRFCPAEAEEVTTHLLVDLSASETPS